MSIEYQIPFIVSSSSASGASNIRSDGSTFEINLETPLIIPNEAKYVQVHVQSATVWFNTYNILAGVNDQFKLSYDDGVLAVDYNLTIEAGIYDLDHLSAAIQRELNDAGGESSWISLTGDSSTQKTVIQFNETATTGGLRIDFTIANTFREVLGFDSRLVPLAGDTTGQEYEYGDDVAQFSPLEYYLLHSDLVSKGIRINNIYSQTIAQILISNVSAGSQIVYEPQNVPKINAMELRNQKRRQIKFWLTDDADNLVDTHSEVWSARIIISYYM